MLGDEPLKLAGDGRIPHGSHGSVISPAISGLEASQASSQLSRAEQQVPLDMGSALPARWDWSRG